MFRSRFNESFVERVLVVPGNDLDWTAVLKFDCGDKSQWNRVARIMEWRDSLTENQKRFIPPLVSDGVVVVEEPKEDIFEVIEEEGNKVEKENGTHIDVEDVEEDGVKEDELVLGSRLPRQ